MTSCQKFQPSERSTKILASNRHFCPFLFVDRASNRDAVVGFNREPVKRVIVGVDKEGATLAANEIDNSTVIADSR